MNVREKTVDHTLGKHVSTASRIAAAAIVMLSPALLFGQGSGKGMKDREIEFAQFLGTPAAEIPSPAAEGLVNVPADTPMIKLPGEGPLVGDTIPSPGAVIESPSGAPQNPTVDQSAPVVGASQYSYAPAHEQTFAETMQPRPSGQPAPVFSSGTWLWNGRWYINADFVALKKESPTSRLVAIDTNTTQIGAAAGGVVLDGALTTDTETHEYEAGARITFGRFLGRDAAKRDHMIDVSFYGLFDWSAEAELLGDDLRTGLTAGDLRTFSPANAEQIPGFSNNDRYSYRYKSKLDSFETSYRIRTRPGRDQMAIHPSGVWTRHASSGQLRGFSLGLRTMSIREGFLTEAFTETERTGMYHVRTNNDMFGPQCGLELIESHDFWHWGFRGNLGSLMNFADRRAEFESILDVPDGNVVREEITTYAQKKSEDQLAFLIQVGFYGAVQLRPNLSLRGSYDFMYITGLAIAPDNARLMGGGDFPGLQTSGHALYHGASFGFESQF